MNKSKDVRFLLLRRNLAPGKEHQGLFNDSASSLILFSDNLANAITMIRCPSFCAQISSSSKPSVSFSRKLPGSSVHGAQLHVLILWLKTGGWQNAHCSAISFFSCFGIRPRTRNTTRLAFKKYSKKWNWADSMSTNSCPSAQLVYLTIGAILDDPSFPSWGFPTVFWCRSSKRSHPNVRLILYTLCCCQTHRAWLPWATMCLATMFHGHSGMLRVLCFFMATAKLTLTLPSVFFCKNVHFVWNSGL